MSKRKGPSKRKSTGTTIAACTFAATTALGVLAWNNERSQVETAQGQLAVAERNADTARDNLRATQGQLAAKQQEVRAAQAQLQGNATARRSAARAMLATASDEEDRRQLLRDFVSELRERAAKPRGGVNFTKAYITGLAEDMVFLKDSLVSLPPTALDLSATDMHGIYFPNVTFNRVILRSADLRAADLSLGSWRRASFEDADLTCATLRRSDFTKSNFEGANLEWVDLRGADLSSVQGLTNAQLTKIAYDDDTTFPASVDVSLLEPSLPYLGAKGCAETKIRPQASSPTPSSTQAGSVPTTTASPPAATSIPP